MAGAVGNFIAAGVSIPFAVFALFLAFGFGFGFFGILSVVALTIAILMATALVIQLIGFYGFWRNYGSRMGVVTFAFGLAAIGVFLGAISLVFVVRDSLSAIVYLAGYVLLGVMFILDGVTFLVNRHFVLPGASIATGVLFIIAGGFVCSILFASVGDIVAMPAFIIGGIVLVNAPIPVLYSPQPDYPPPPGARPPFPP